jgi:hypothetical protein
MSLLGVVAEHVGDVDERQRGTEFQDHTVHTAPTVLA